MIKFIEDKELCIKLKEKGFDEGCILQYRGEDTQPICQMGYELNYEKNSDYNNDDNYWLSIPTYCQVIDWLREKHRIEVSSPCKKDKDLGVFYGGYVKKYDDNFGKSYGSNFRDYYEAYNHGIEDALKLI